MPDPRGFDLALSTFWNEVAAGHPGDATGLDPETEDTIRRLHHLASAPLPGSARERVWRGLMTTPDVRVNHKEPDMTHVTDLFGGKPRVGPVRWPMVLHVAPGPRPRPARINRLALIAAILVVLAAIAGWAWLGASVPKSGEPRHAAVPALIVTPRATPDPAAVEGVLVDMTLSAAPAEPQFADIERVDFGSGATELENCMGTSNFVMFVTQGELTGSVTGPPGIFARVIRDMNGQAEDLARGGPLRLTAGDTLAVGAGAGFRLEHAAGLPASIVSFNIFTADFATATCGLGATVTNITADLNQLGTGNDVPSPGPQHLVARRVRLAPGATFRQPPAAGQVVVLAPEDTAMTVAISDSKTEATNVDNKPVSLLVMTLAPLGGTGSPVASPAS